jgi:hypothetical protein
MTYMTKRPIVSSCGLCGAMEMVTADLKLTDARDACAVGFLMGIGSLHGQAIGALGPICNRCKAEVDAIMQVARAKNRD